MYPLGVPVVEHRVYSGRQVGAVSGGNHQEPVALGQRGPAQRSILRPEHVKRVLRMHEVDQRFGVPPQLDGHRDRVLERIEELIRVPNLDFLVSAHPLLARQPLPLGSIEPHPVAAEPYLPHPVTGGGSYGGADVVRELGIDQRHSGGDPIILPNRPGHDTHEFDDADRGV